MATFKTYLPEDCFDYLEWNNLRALLQQTAVEVDAYSATNTFDQIAAKGILTMSSGRYELRTTYFNNINYLINLFATTLDATHLISPMRTFVGNTPFTYKDVNKWHYNLEVLYNYALELQL